ncbi:MAG: hypothetical protein JSW27_18395 [Phycisphaerales bacterium]|nr:MAG: hypothetical protein JSW27_18395 [Phycisphaerales bacterium]
MRSMLTRLQSSDKPIRLAIIGIGSVGEGLLYQSSITAGMQCVAIADINADYDANRFHFEPFSLPMNAN